MEGYFHRPEATREVLTDGWLDTGDLGFLHNDELYLTGRSKDVLILRGRSHSPTEVEAALDEVEGVRRGCSVAVSWLPDGADGEELLLLVEVGRDAVKRDPDAIVEDCRTAVLAATGLEVDRVEVLEPGTLPRTSSGKLRRQASLRLLTAGELAPPEKVTAWRLAGAAVKGSFQVARVNRRAGD
jgi:acyl-CoA synthetase (AMP-forming)/AMP-acid ligase II